ncbi:oligosaccharide flippase family protein [Pseudohalocynthiibacter sp. F2068]|jgi:O-antigen/teichoic acid export membrane protein|uniref:oligosaccharide flippase family protein n=1 Tax=Pseudohalocynthiibacter sp. F2068 TaxID=2926418 RepID=UPI001FF27688|nr:oligosaccharide flippase family protein [Pseudohalocynthiibacter sp. F2068]MCK0104295.1 oligosaccharide flippase family protein [Pseudohalocynthiibacter sp. F2068]
MSADPIIKSLRTALRIGIERYLPFAEMKANAGACISLRALGELIRHPFRFMAFHSVGVVKNPGVKFIRDLAYLAFSQVAIKVIGFVVFAYMARTLQPAGYGLVEYLFSLTAFAALVVDFGLGPVAVRARTKGDDSVVNAVPTLRALIAIIAVPTVILVVFLTTDDPVAHALGCLFGASLLLHAWKQEWLLQSIEQIDRVAIAQMFRVVTFSGIILLMVSGVQSILWVGVAEVLSVIVWIGFYLKCQLQAGFNLSLNFDKAVLANLLREGAPLGMTSIIWGFVQYVPPILVANIVGLEEAAYLAAAQRLVVSLQSFSYIYHFNLYAALTRRFEIGRSFLEQLSLASFRIVAWAVIGPTVLVSFHATSVVTTIFGSNYQTSGLVLSILIFVLPIQFLSGHHRWALTAMGQSRAVLFSGVSGAILSLILAPLLILQWGAVGGGIAILLSSLTVWFVAVTFCRRNELDLPVLPRLIRPLLTGAAAIFLTEIALSGNWAARAILAVVLYVVFALFVDRKIFGDLRHLAYAKKDVVTKT